MMDFNDLEYRQALRQACCLFGGIKPVSAAIDINHSNLSRWFRGYKTLSEAKVFLLLKYLGLCSGEPDVSFIHVWDIKRANTNFTAAFSLYFPNGAVMACAPSNNVCSQMIAVTDGTVRALVKIPSTLMVQKITAGSLVTWRGGQRSNSMLRVTQSENFWKSGSLNIEEFDALWGEPLLRKKTFADVTSVIQTLGLTHEEAIKRLRGESVSQLTKNDAEDTIKVLEDELEELEALIAPRRQAMVKARSIADKAIREVEQTEARIVTITRDLPSWKKRLSHF